jgi:MFS transporter, PAT family, solute carrier family 33 (acetyl-CoA transportor), member 1
MAFMAKISDPLLGASYMTLLNTVVSRITCGAFKSLNIFHQQQSNLGGSWVKTFFMWFVDIVTWKSCVIDQSLNDFNSTYSFDANKCVDKTAKSECIDNGGRCNVDSDGYYTEVIINVIYGIIWYQWAKRILNYLQELPVSDWHVLSRTEDDDLEYPELEKLEESKRESTKE